MIRFKKKVNVFVVGGGPRCRAMLETAYQICEDSSKLRFAGYIADRPRPNERSPRYTMYPEFGEYPLILRAVAEELNVPIYSERIDGSYEPDENGYSAFQRWLYEEALGRHVGDTKNLNTIFLMACFGSRVTRPTINITKGWYFNYHPNIVGFPWGKTNPFKGAQPYENMLEVRRKLEKKLGRKVDLRCELVAHIIDNTFDNGIRAFGVGKEKLPPYEGKISYERWTPACQKMVVCRPRAQGKWIHDMHERMAPLTSLLTKRVLENRKVIDAILDGCWASRKLIRKIFPNKGKKDKPPCSLRSCTV